MIKTIYICVCVCIIYQVTQVLDVQVLRNHCGVLTRSVLRVWVITLAVVCRMAQQGPGLEACHGVNALMKALNDC